MLKRPVLIAGILLGLMGAPAIASDDTVYIDGLPCGTFCQAYMAWARSYGQPARQADSPAQRPAESAVAHARKANPKLRPPATSSRVGAPKTRLSKQRHAPQVSPNQPQISRSEDSATGSIGDQSKAPDVATPDSNPGAGEASSDAVSVQHDVTDTRDAGKPEGAATTAGQPADTPNPKVAVSPGETTASTPGDIRLVAIIFARPEIGSVSELSGKQIAIVESESRSAESIRSAIAAAGASGVQLSDSAPINAMDGVITGQIPAAVIALLSSEAADRFREISGFNIFRVPVSLP